MDGYSFTTQKERQGEEGREREGERERIAPANTQMLVHKIHPD